MGAYVGPSNSIKKSLMLTHSITKAVWDRVEILYERLNTLPMTNLNAKVASYPLAMGRRATTSKTPQRKSSHQRSRHYQRQSTPISAPDHIGPCLRRSPRFKKSKGTSTPTSSTIAGPILRGIDDAISSEWDRHSPSTKNRDSLSTVSDDVDLPPPESIFPELFATNMRRKVLLNHSDGSSLNTAKDSLRRVWYIYFLVC